jgi:hypothetical protein
MNAGVSIGVLGREVAPEIIINSDAYAPKSASTLSATTGSMEIYGIEGGSSSALRG